MVATGESELFVTWSSKEVKSKKNYNSYLIQYQMFCNERELSLVPTSLSLHFVGDNILTDESPCGERFPGALFDN